MLSQSSRLTRLCLRVLKPRLMAQLISLLAPACVALLWLHNTTAFIGNLILVVQLCKGLQILPLKIRVIVPIGGRPSHA